MTKIAAMQMCSSPSVDENLNITAKLIAEAAHHDAELIVLPEMFAQMGNTVMDKIAIQETFGAGDIQEFLSVQAQKHHVWIVGGTLPLATEDKNKVRAACLVFNDQGEIAARYDKIHLFDVEISQDEIYRESDTVAAGDDIVVVDTPFGKLGLAVCYDVRFPELFRQLFNQGAEIFVLPSAFTVKTGAAHWEVLTRARAIENFCYLIGAAQGGKHANGRQTYGHSLVVEPWGKIIAQIPGETPGILYADIDLKNIYAARKSIPIDKHQKLNVK